MATEVETGHGSTFALENGSGTLVVLGEVTGVIPIPSGAADLINVSHFQSVDFMDYIQSPLQDGEEVELEMNWIPNSTTDALCREAKGKTRDYEIVLPVGAGTWEISGSVLVRDYIRANPMSAQRSARLRVKWVGESTEAAGV